jgi:hypothetical protein
MNAKGHFFPVLTDSAERILDSVWVFIKHIPGHNAHICFPLLLTALLWCNGMWPAHPHGGNHNRKQMLEAGWVFHLWAKHTAGYVSNK